MQNKHTRREMIRLLGLAGFSLYLPACTSPVGEQSSENKTVTDTSDTNAVPFEAVKEEIVLESNNVKFFRKEDERYAELGISFNLRVQKQPTIIALCENTQGVREAVRLAIKENLPISIKSGGHSFEGFSSNNGGMQINLSLLNQVEFLEDDLITVGPGCKLKDLYDAILPKNRILPAGSCGTVGVGGLTLGGGYGFFARKYGLTCDSLVEATMVDGKGEIHKTQNGEELMWALKGGGNGNFGVVTEMKFKSHRAPKAFTRHRFKAYKLNAERAKNLLKEWFEYTKDLPVSAFSAFVLNEKTLTLLITHFESRNAGIDKMIKRFEEITDKASIGGPRELAKSLTTYYGIQTPIYFKNASAGYYNDFSDIENCIDDVIEKVVSTNGLIYQVNTLGGNIASEEFEKESCYAHRSLPYLSELQSYWDGGKKTEERLLKAFEEIQKLFFENGIRTQYRNYPDINFRDWEHAYFGSENYPRLQDIKRLYDPENRIQHPQSIKI